MIAADTKGPINDDVFPIIEKRAKKRNFGHQSFKLSSTHLFSVRNHL
jgi:hypothetical protein